MSQQEIEQRIKKAYDALPYPGIGVTVDPQINWSWVNMPWIRSLLPFALDGEFSFKRILIAGCGTGNEAFQMRNLFPHAEITAVDYSEASILVARKYQNDHPKYKEIHFEVDDLTIGEGHWAKADYYDFISCHGTMTYIPNTQKAFDSIAKCLAPEGFFYMGANGSKHISIPMRKSFEYLGYDSSGFSDSVEMRRLIELFDRLNPSQSHLSAYTAAYLDSDLLNTFSLNLTLAEWVEYAKNANLHFVSSAEFIPNLAKTLSPNIFPLLFPQSRQALCQLVAIHAETSFHKLIFSKQAPPEIPWDNLDALLDCEFQTTDLYLIQNPISDIYGELILNATIAQGLMVGLRWPMLDVSFRLFGQRNGKGRLRDAVGDYLEPSIRDEYSLIIRLFMFYQLGIIKIFPNPPASTYTE